MTPTWDLSHPQQTALTLCSRCYGKLLHDPALGNLQILLFELCQSISLRLEWPWPDIVEHDHPFPPGGSSWDVR